MEAFTRAGAFLCALFVTLLRYLEEMDAKVADISRLPDNKLPKSLGGKFRLLMTEGQTFYSQGQLRTQFYEEVLGLAHKVCLSRFIFRLVSIHCF